MVIVIGSRRESRRTKWVSVVESVPHELRDQMQPEGEFVSSVMIFYTGLRI